MFTAQFLSRETTIPALAVGGASLRAAKRTASKACRTLGASVSVTLRVADTDVSYFDGSRWRDLYRSEFLARVYGVAA